MRPFWRTDGWRNGIELWAVTHLAPLWWLLQRLPLLRSATNRLIINQMVYKMGTRPERLSTKSDYTSWDSLRDRSFSERHLPADPELQQRLPPIERAVELFHRRPTGAVVSTKSTLLFPHFAQWFVDGFLRTDPADVRKNTSTHDIDLSQLYGQTEATAGILRSHQGGRLKSQMIDGREFPPFYLDDNGQVKPEFEDLLLQYPERDRKAVDPAGLDAALQRKLFALPVPRGNIHYGFTMMSTLFLREHNRLAGLIAAEHPKEWDDARVFQTTRNTMIVLLLKIVVEDYINHITPFHFKLFVEPGIGVKEKWYRQNWMSVEFNLLYRWHPLVPTRVRVGGRERSMDEVQWNNAVVIENGLAKLFDEASRQPADEIGLLNTAPFLLPVDQASLEIGREVRLAGYNAYRRACRYPKLKSFDDVCSDPDVRNALRERYEKVDDIELVVGLFAEDVRRNAALPTLMGTMVAVDAFSQALTNPLLAPGIFTEATFSKAGMAAIKSTSRLEQIVRRNVEGEGLTPLATLTREDWTPR